MTSALYDPFYGPILARGTITPSFKISPLLAEAIAIQVGTATECHLDQMECEGLVALVVLGLEAEGYLVRPPENVLPNSEIASADGCTG